MSNDSPFDLGEFDFEQPQEVDGTLIEEEGGIDETPAENNGLCRRCKGTGYVHSKRGGVEGVVYNLAGTDTQGNVKKRLVVCTHGKDYGY